MAREALIERNTKETQIRLKLNIDGTGSSDTAHRLPEYVCH